MNEVLQPTQTFGQQLVGVKFNPSGLTEVDKIKQQFADIIDDITEKQMKVFEEVNSILPEDITLENSMNFSLKSNIGNEAVMRLADACMWAVKFYVS